MSEKPFFVVQEHHASRLHWDFRLQVGGVLRSWAIPKGPSLDPAQKRLAVEVEDHDLAYADYEGIIPEGGYGAGPVIAWDRGPFAAEGDASQGLDKGVLDFSLDGKILRGAFALVRLKGAGRQKNWLLIKKRDAHAREGWETPMLLTPQVRKKLKVRTPPCGAS